MIKKTGSLSVALLFGAVLVAGFLAACTNDTGDPAMPGGTGGSATPPAPSSSSSVPEAKGKGVPASCNGDDGGSVPTNAKDLNAWLQKRAYECWAHESAPHQSAGPHGGKVQTYLNATLTASLDQKNAEHTQGSVAVKELYGEDASGGITGWAVGVKTQPTSAGGDNWFWYEVFTVSPSDTAPYASLGASICKNCHAGSDKDFVLIPYPLQ